MEWDRSQRAVIDAASEARLLVGAGPGTGKTAVACGRVSRLIDQEHIEPSGIWLISFTRTAVREIRDRIATHLEDASMAYSVKIATLDSHAWAVHSGFDEEANTLVSYDDNINGMLDLLRTDEVVAEYVENVKHLFVDEAQDIVGIRADLVVEFILRMSSSSGVTIFTDDAQAIYGFTDDNVIKAGESREPPLPNKIRTGEAGRFYEHELTEVHRTGSPQLLAIFSDTRRKVMTAASEREDRLALIKAEVRRLAHGKAPYVVAGAAAAQDDTFILYRRRCDVLMATAILADKGIPHRVRMSGLPVCLAAWIGAALSEHTGPDLRQHTFLELWADKVQGTPLETCDATDAWAKLVRIAGRTHALVEMRRLRQRLGRRQPPAELCQAELGQRGPIVGTIHAAKGREADTVHLMLSSTHADNFDQDEEARVVFVGATRSRSCLLTGQAYRQFAGRIEESGRAYRLLPKGDQRVQVEIGRDSDVEAAGVAGCRLFASAAAVRASQTRIRQRFANAGVSLVAEIDRAADFAYRLREDERRTCVAVLSQNVNRDLFTVAKAIQQQHGGIRRPPHKIPYLHVRGVRTIVLPPDAPESDMLYDPWRSSGIMLAPLVLGYTTVSFPSRRQRKR